jgi:hypothetical protein
MRCRGWNESQAASGCSSAWLGGRPRKPTVEEARRAALDELVPKALRVLNEHLDKGGADAWRAALRVFEYEFGRAAEQPQEPFVMPTTVEEVEKLSWDSCSTSQASTPMS